MLLRLDAITTDRLLQPRVEHDSLIIAEYAEAMREGAVFPPVTVFHDGAKYWLADGYHRLAAALRAQREEVEAEVKQGTYRDAILHSVGVNAEHGYRRKNADKRKAVTTLLRDPEWAQWSDREIARQCAVSDWTVRRYRSELSARLSQIDAPRLVTRGGTTYTMDTTNIGGGLSEEVVGALLLVDDAGSEQAAKDAAKLARQDAATQRIATDLLVSGEVSGVKQALKVAQEQIDERVDQEALPEEETDPVQIALGEWWQLGDHLLYCGDSTSEEFIAVLCEAAPIPFAFADPPYGSGKDEWDTAFAWAHDYLAEVAAVVAVTPGNWNLFDFARQTAMPYAWTFTCWINNGMTRGSMGFGNTILVPLFASGSIHREAQDFMQTSVSNADTEETAHRTRKPAGLLTKLIGLYTAEGDVVADPFLGSGTTLRAADALGRKCIGADIEPAYCAEIIARWQAKAGKQAVRQ